MDFQHFFEALFAGVIGMLGFFVKGAHNKAEKTADELNDFKQHVAVDYATKDSINVRFDKIDNKLEKMLDKMDSLKK